MKKLTLILCFLLCFSFLPILPCNAAETVQGYIANAAYLSTISGDSVQVLVLTADRTKHIYTLANSVTINGTVIKPKEAEEFYAMAEQLRENFAEIKCNGELVTEISLDTEPELFYNVTYNPTTGKFSGLDAVLPVFDSCGEYIPALDVNHIYTIEVYSCAVNITEKTAIEEDKMTVHRISAESGAQKNFLLSLTAAFETGEALTATAEAAACRAELYDADGKFLQEAEESVSFLFVQFGDLPNVNREYKISLWLEDAEGNTVSSVCTFVCSTTSLPVGSGYMDAVGTQSDISGEYIVVRICNAAGETQVFPLAFSVIIDGISTGNTETMKESLSPMTLVEFMCNEGGEICVIRPYTMEKRRESCNVSNAVVYKDRFEAEVQFEESYTGSSALVLVALYDENGKMTGWTFETVEVPEDKSESVSVSASIDASDRYKNGKVFLWGSLLAPCS